MDTTTTTTAKPNKLSWFRVLEEEEVVEEEVEQEEEAEENNENEIDNNTIPKKQKIEHPPTTKPIPVSNFYGTSQISKEILQHPTSQQSKKIQQWQSFYAKFLSYTHSLKPKKEENKTNRGVWKIFIKQSQAFDYQSHYRLLLSLSKEGEESNNNDHDPKVFSFEYDTSSPGKRKFLVVSSHASFFQRYKQMPLTKRHYYEVIRENEPCRLYFDIEYMKALNTGVDGDALIQLFIKVVNVFLKTVFVDTIPALSTKIIDLSSTTETKFSRHLIFHLLDGDSVEKVLFRDNTQIKHFIDYLTTILTSLITTPSLQMLSNIRTNLESSGISIADIEALFITEETNTADTTIQRKKLFFDESVYSRNRNFRIVYSTKRGKQSPLIPIESTESGDTIPSSFELNDFLDTLICYTPFRDDEYTYLTFGDDTQPPPSSHPSHPTPSHPQQNPQQQQQPYTFSPFPELDTFVLTTLHTALPTPFSSFKSITYFPSTKTIIYTPPATHRYCFTINRPHKSNGVYYVLDLWNGVLRQRCYDVECKRSVGGGRCWSVPLEKNPVVALMRLVEEDGVDWDDDEEDNENDKEKEDSDSIPDTALLEAIQADASQQWF